MSTKKLYVDNFSPDGSLAMTTNKLSVSYNLIVLDRSNPDSSPIFTIGKYLVLNFASEENPPKINMTFVDVKKSPETVQEIINSPEFSNKKDKLISMLEMFNATYESTKHYIELVKGIPPNVRPLDENYQ